MDDKKLHRLNKTELLWIIRDQEAELEELREYVKRLGGNPDKKADDSTEQPQPERRRQGDKPRHTDKGGVS